MLGFAFFWSGGLSSFGLYAYGIRIVCWFCGCWFSGLVFVWCLIAFLVIVSCLVLGCLCFMGVLGAFALRLQALVVLVVEWYSGGFFVVLRVVWV